MDIARDRPLSRNSTRLIDVAAAVGRRALGRVSPRPAVGAVVVRDGQIVGEGSTSPQFGPHAEPQALEAAGALARGADLYVTLEPCAHFGHTPPCTQAIIAAGIARCHIACSDPNPVSGNGAAILQAAGIEVTFEDSAAARDGLKGYLKTSATGMPYVIAKWAMSLDGQLTKRGGGYLTGPAARALVHRRRSEVDAIAIGSGTALADDPLLTVRSPIFSSKQPLRVVLDGRGRIGADAAMLKQPGSTVIFTSAPESGAPFQFRPDGHLRVRGIEPSPAGNIDSVLENLAEMGVQTILLEGGSQVLRSFFAAGRIDEVEVFLAAILADLAGDAPAPLEPGQSTATDLELIEWANFEGDLWARYLVRPSAAAVRSAEK